MRTYKIVKKGLFENNDKFEKRLDHLALASWRAISIAPDHSTISVLMEKDREY